MSASVIGLDTAKNVFHLHGVDERGRALGKRQYSDFERLLEFDLVASIFNTPERAKILFPSAQSK